MEHKQREREERKRLKIEKKLKKKEKERKKNALKDTELHERVRRAATARPERIWDYGVIPYEIEANFSGNSFGLFLKAVCFFMTIDILLVFGHKWFHKQFS